MYTYIYYITETYFQIVTSAQLLLADLYVSDSIDNLDMTPDSTDTESDTEEVRIYFT